MAARKSLNVGILGHVDSGKTTLAKTISTMSSTAAFDKHAETSSFRANTIDLGYSMLTVDDTIIALIDCPGHASLIRSVLAASSVFDMAIVVINSSKGIEQQTAEHLLLVSLLCPDHVIIVINKIDLIDEEAEERMKRRCRKAASVFKLNSNLQIILTSLTVHKEEATVALINALRLALYTPQRVSSGHFVMFVDHCFPVKGKGTVMTGTVVDGMCNIGMEVEIAALQEKRKIKSMQCWKENVHNVGMGDRAAVLFHNVSAKNINRTLIFEPGTLRYVQFLLVSVNRIVHFQEVLHQNSKLHVSTGFDTVIGQCQFLASSLPGEKDNYEVVRELDGTVKFAILSLGRSVYTKEGNFFITSRLDHQGKGCRFVFHGIFLKLLDNDKEICRFRRKKKVGKVERIENERSVICNSLFKKEANIDIYRNMNVYLSTGEIGRLESSFGKNGKVRVSFSEDLPESTTSACKNGLEIQDELKGFTQFYISSTNDNFMEFFTL
ncbi:Selenocysteine-specific elongation factor [Dirofilaria immitis]